uniref:methionine--tRNA ligase n=1 Tax=Blastobotrys adeninivorans TaxID=409370 RepID=A0A060TCJ7_BLAAD
MSVLVCPQASTPLELAQVTKAVLAVALFDPSVKIEPGPVASPVLKISPDSSLIEPNAIVRYLAKTETSKADNVVISLEETVLYGSLKQGVKLDEKAATPLSDKLPAGTNIGPATVILFSALHGLVSFLGKVALSQDLQIALWYQKLSGNARIQTALKGLAPFFTKSASPASVSRSVSSAAAAKPDAANDKPKPERTGAVKVDESVLRKKHDGVILPKEGERNVLITSALPYVNNVPHLGNIVGSVLSADVFSRYAKARNYNTLYICGTDEYGTATETKALEEKMSPYELTTKYYTIHKGVYEWFQIGFDYFGRTSTEKQTEICQDIFLKVHKNDFTEVQTSEQLYCNEHKGFLADRFVEGTCPKCGYEDARGDQCDSCGQLLNPFELINPRCKLDNSDPVKRETKHIYLSLDKLQDKIAEWNEKSQSEGQWSKNGKVITESWLKEGLRPRAITRDLKWGVPVPLEEFKDKVFYVWFDACIGYVSITANYTDEWQKWWKNPDNVKLYQFMGKDNVPFHTVVFPGTEIATGEQWTMLHHLSTTEYLQYEGGKFSKSRGLGVFGNTAQDIGLSPSLWRYYLISARPESSDSQFSWSEFVARNNSELLANLGNFVNRLVKFVIAKYNGVIPDYDPKALGEKYTTFSKEINELIKAFVDAMEGVHLRLGLETAMQISARGNQFLQENKLDNTLFAQSPEKANAVVGVGLNLIYILSAVLTPFMPETSDSILEQLNAPERAIPDSFDFGLKGGHNIGKAKYLFKRIEESKIDEWRAKYGGKQE